MEQNRYGVKSRVWKMWDDKGRASFNDICDMFLHRKNYCRIWNAAFVAACEASGLNVEYEARHG